MKFKVILDEKLVWFCWDLYWSYIHFGDDWH